MFGEVLFLSSSSALSYRAFVQDERSEENGHILGKLFVLILEGTPTKEEMWGIEASSCQSPRSMDDHPGVNWECIG